jgi:hypothetical protein
MAVVAYASDPLSVGDAGTVIRRPEEARVAPEEVRVARFGGVDVVEEKRGDFRDRTTSTSAV